MTEDQYWEAQWLIDYLHEGPYGTGPVGAMSDDVHITLDFLLSLGKGRGEREVIEAIL